MAAQEIVGEAQMAKRHQVVLVLLEHLAQERQVGDPVGFRRGRFDRRGLPRLDNRPLLLQKAAHDVEILGHDAGARIGLEPRIGVDVRRSLGLAGDDDARLDPGDRRRGARRAAKRPQGLTVEVRIANHRHGVVEQHTVGTRVDRLRQVDGGDAPAVEQRLQAHRPPARVELGENRQQLLDAVAAAQVAGDRDLRLAGRNVVDECGEVARRARPRRSSRRHRRPSARSSRESAPSATTAPRRACARRPPCPGRGWVDAQE